MAGEANLAIIHKFCVGKPQPLKKDDDQPRTVCTPFHKRAFAIGYISVEEGSPMLGPRFTLGTLGIAVAPAIGLTALSYGNGYSLLTSTIVGAATGAVGLWALMTEP